VKEMGKRINFMMPEKLYAMLKNEAENNGVALTAMINISVKEYLKQSSILELTEFYKKAQLINPQIGKIETEKEDTEDK
jgi:hypothetical protein